MGAPSITSMSESDASELKGSRVRRGRAGIRENAVNDATPDVQSPGTITEIDEADEQKSRKRAASRGNRSRQR
jgi:hypothetical protein